jgi:hypothetical protein
VGINHGAICPGSRDKKMKLGCIVIHIDLKLNWEFQAESKVSSIPMDSKISISQYLKI